MPYDRALTLRGKAVLEEFGLEVVNAECLPGVKSIFDETPRRVYGLLRSANRPEAEAVFVSRVGLPTISVLGAAETDLGKPVLSERARHYVERPAHRRHRHAGAWLWSPAGGPEVPRYSGLRPEARITLPQRTRSASRNF